jgi:acyl-coenzyme A thioesterase PaaI-like protein
MSAAEIVASVPFNQHVGVTARPDARLQLPDDPQLLNHVGTCHAGALFTLGDATSGATLFDALGARLGDTMAVVRAARIEFLKPARGVLVGTGTVDGEAALTRIERDGKADVDVSVEVTDSQGTVVARLVITWALRRPRA